MLRRHAGRVRYEPADRVWLAALARLIPRNRWTEVFPVTPATLLAWHRRLAAKKYDTSKRRKPGRPPTVSGVARLIVRLANENPLWGTPPDPRPADETRRDSRAVHRLGDPAGRGHLSGAAPGGSDLAAVPARPGRRDRRGRLPARGHRAAEKTVPVFIEHGTRRMHLGGITANPTGEWTVQQARNLALTLDGRFGTSSSCSVTTDRTSRPRSTPSSRPPAPGSCAPPSRHRA